jgi:DNA-directed RNA polymerase subunit RPC12/RpoP
MKNLIKTFESFSYDDFNEMDHMDDSHSIEHEEHHEAENYMFFGNLETIHRLTGMILEMEPSEIDRILKNGHNWAVDHIATSKDDIEEVANFLINEMGEDSDMQHAGYEEYMEESDQMAYEGYICESCGSAYESKDMNDDMTCNECGGKVMLMEGGW